MKRGGTRKRGKFKKGKGKVSDAEKELANINQLLKARAQKNVEFYIFEYTSYICVFIIILSIILEIKLL